MVFTMTAQITIHRRFNGPPNSGHGGYVCGLIADRIGSCVEITLRFPPPLDRPLTVETVQSGEVRLLDEDITIAEGRKAELHLEIPDPPTFEEPKRAVERYPGFESHPFPTCFGCGHKRVEGDGLRIFSGPVNKSGIMAAPWRPDDSLVGETGRVGTEFLWAALDCPAGWAAVNLQNALAADTAYILLGRSVAEVKEGLKPGQNCVTIGWPIGKEGRKLFSGSAIFLESGELLAAGRATWIAMKPPT